MSGDILGEFPGFIQEYVYRKGWQDLREDRKSVV